MSPPALPIDPVLPGIITALKGGNRLLLRAPAGAGKTTRVPPALLDAGLAGHGQILLLEPRRLAARAAARRMAQERGQSLGQDIGYHVRFERRAGPNTRILAITPGILLRWLQDDPFLSQAGIVLFDEFHERGADTDLALGMLRLVQESVRPELKLVLMSATLAAEPLLRYLDGCPLIESPGRLFPVRVDYQPRPVGEPLGQGAAGAVLSVLEQTDGDVLVFLPGMREIRQAMRYLESDPRGRGLALFPLHGDLPPEEQDAALAPCPRRKVILATNVAESSITVEGVSVVIDTGQARSLRLDANLGLDRLELGPIPRDSAEQRAGRAGRTRPGLCIRLWSEAWQRNLPEHIEPEITRVDLAGPLLHLLALGEGEWKAFPWLDPPPEDNARHAFVLLKRLEAVDADNRITALGRLLARFPVHPRVGRLLVEGWRLGYPDRAALAAALLGERDVFVRGDRSSAAPTRSDLLDRVEALEAFQAREGYQGMLGELNRGTARFLLQTQKQLARLLEQEEETLYQTCPKENGREGDAPARSSDADEALLRALLAAYPDRVARRRQPGERRGLLLGGRGVVLAPSSGVREGELFLAIDLDAGQEEALVRLASSIRRDWLPPGRLHWDTTPEFDAALEKVVVHKRLLLEDLVLEEAGSAHAPAERVQEVLLEAAYRNLPRVVPEKDSPVGQFLLRARCLAAWMPELNLPRFDEAELRELLPWLAAGRRSFADLRAGPWLELMQGKLTPQQSRALEREAPEHLEVPSGSRIALEYQEGRPPILAVRVQELFGLADTPRLAGGRVKVLLHLLAPNYRPQQITDDLASFWKNTYPTVRKDLRARYPRHPWPEDPLRAAAIRK